MPIWNGLDGGELIARWQQEQTYPYPGQPRTVLESAEREIFDVVALATATMVESVEATARRFALLLLREVLASRPQALHRVIGDVLGLPREQVEELARLLDKGVALPSVIAASTTIADRLDFLSGLDMILFDAATRKATLERRQLHRILAQETWLFGEEYALTGDDERLTSVLRKYLHMLGQDVELADSGGAHDEEGLRRAIPDLVLSRQVAHQDNVIENLVIELKRPTVTIGRDELDQIEDYAFKVAGDERFAQPNARWEFWIVGNELDMTVQRKARQAHLPAGVTHQDENVRIWAKRWSEVIGDAKHRLKFVRDSLAYMSTRDSGLDYLRRTHAHYLPAPLVATHDELAER